MMKTLRQVWKTPELRNSILFVIAMLVVFRVASHIPVPGVNPDNLRAFFQKNQILGLVNLFSGGALRNFSVVALGVGPYITASIIFQLLAMIIPRLEEMQKDGESGQQRINQYTRIATVPLAMLQAYSMISLLRQSQQPIIGALSPLEFAGILLTMTAGTMLLMWIGELISEKKIGNGVSIIIFAGIIAGLPQALQQGILTFDQSQIINMVAFAAIGVITVAGVVFITEGQRNIPVVYAKRMRGTRLFGGQETYLPLRANMAGVIPIIFAVSIILFPTMVAQLFIHAKTPWVANAAQQTIALLQNQLIYGVAFFLLVFIFTYFYTAVVFHPDRVAENLQKQGGYIPGIRPGRPTSEYLMRTVNRIIPAGAFFLAVIAVLPIAIQNLTGSRSLVVGGTGLLIVVSVVIEIVNQINSQLTMREYESL
ncbi:MAG TPA: preprotein translocase subunit SecY [Candidatus Eisenbacteria bacterium]|nr:preprotein translocase subunit SecY [Candidatus Eisenbacteria bacterium]